MVAATIVLIDGIWFLQAFLSGEITARFVLDSLLLLVLGGGVVAGFRLLGSPAYQRRISVDRATIADLKAIVFALTTKNGAASIELPARLSRSDANGFGRGPVDTTPYVYRRIDARDYEICATFLEPSPPDADPDDAHRSGNVCYRYQHAGMIPSRSLVHDRT